MFWADIASRLRPIVGVWRDSINFRAPSTARYTDLGTDKETGQQWLAYMFTRDTAFMDSFCGYAKAASKS